MDQADACVNSVCFEYFAPRLHLNLKKSHYSKAQLLEYLNQLTLKVSFMFVSQIITLNYPKDLDYLIVTEVRVKLS